jgi:hypothetical protein
MSFDFKKYSGGGDFVKFDEIGDAVVGTIKEIREGRDYNGNPCPELVLEVSEDGDEKTVTAGQALLKAALAEAAPQVGNKIRITYTGNSQGKPGRNPAKEFKVEVKPGTHELVQPAVSNSEAPF